MIILDTNVLSEVMRQGGSAAVANWVDRFRPGDLFTTAVNKAEILRGLAMMSKGRKRTDLIALAEAMFSEDFRGRVLSFDERAADHNASIATDCARAGRSIEVMDAQIAAIARANGMSLATRNVRHFVDCGIEVVSPWDA